TIAVFYFFTPLLSRFTQTNLSEESVIQRQLLVNASWQMITEKPILGVGLGNFLPTLARIQKPLSLGLYLQPVHNIFLLIFAETGIAGLAFFLWFLAKTYSHLFLLIRKEKYARKLSLCFSLILSSALLLGLFDHYFLTLQQGQLLLA